MRQGALFGLGRLAHDLKMDHKPEVSLDRVIPACFAIAVVVALIFGLLYRIEHIERRQFRADESMTALRVSGRTFASFNRLFDGGIYSVNQVRAFQRVNPGLGATATVAGLAAEEPQSAPLFFVIDRWWAGMAGSSIVALRLPSLLASLAAIAALYWFCFELTRSHYISGAAAALMAVSPFFINYGAQAREYALWTFLLIAASAFLLRALRSERSSTWLWYAATMALALYADPLTLLVGGAHALYVLVLYRSNARALVDRVPARGV